MSHARQQIREACAALVTGLTTTGSRVHQSRMRPQGSAGLPCLLVTTNDEEIQPGTIGNLYERTLTLVIRGFAMGSATLDDTLDQIAVEVETAMAGYTRAVFDKLEVDFEDEIEKPVGSIALTYRVTYFTASGTPGTLI
jgi:hypothetical protein